MPSPSVDHTHPDYDLAVDAWRLVRDTAFGGGRKVKAEGYRYLPSVSGMSPADYNAYRHRALFYNATKRTLAAYVGFIFANNPEVEPGSEDPSTNVKMLLNDATMSGHTFYDYLKQATRNVVSLGRTGTLLEWADPAMANRPFVIRYETEDILNWRYDVVNGRRQLTMVALRECREVPSQDYFQPETEVRIRVLRLVAQGGPYCLAELFRKDVNGEWDKIDEQVPMRRTVPLDFIPFVFHNTMGDEACPSDVPLDDLAQVNVSHYCNSADIEQGRHICGLPTLVLAGFPLKGEYFLGSTQAIVSEEPTASAAFLQIDANSLSALSTGMEEKERQMAALGARMLEQQGQGNGPEAYQTVQIRQSGEVASLTDIAISCSETLSKVLRLARWWDDATVKTPDDLMEDVYVELNTEFTQPPMDPAKLTALLQAYQTNAISYEEFFRNMQKGGVISTEKKIEDELAAIEENPQNLPKPGDVPPNPGPGKPPAKQPPAKNPPAGG
jgi:hypothetical protein